VLEQAHPPTSYGDDDGGDDDVCDGDDGGDAAQQDLQPVQQEPVQALVRFGHMCSRQQWRAQRQSAWAVSVS